MTEYPLIIKEIPSIIDQIIDQIIDGPIGWYKCEVGILISSSKNSHLQHLFESISPYWINEIPFDIKVEEDSVIIRYPKTCTVVCFDPVKEDQESIQNYIKDLGVKS